MLAAPDPPAQLVELGDAEALGALDQHHGRVRHVDPDLDHRRRHQHVGLPGGERRHRLRLLGRVHLPVDQPDAEVAQLAAAQPLGLLPGRLAGHFLGDLDQRADDERLAPLAQPLPQEFVGAPRDRPRRRLSSSPACAPPGRLWSAVVSRSPYSVRDRVRGIGVAVMWRTCGAHPGDPLGVERLPLRDPEAVLLVDHDEAEAGEVDGRLDQRVRPDDQPELAAEASWFSACRRTAGGASRR